MIPDSNQECSAPGESSSLLPVHKSEKVCISYIHNVCLKEYCIPTCTIDCAVPTIVSVIPSTITASADSFSLEHHRHLESLRKLAVGSMKMIGIQKKLPWVVQNSKLEYNSTSIYPIYCYGSLILRPTRAWERDYFIYGTAPT